VARVSEGESIESVDRSGNIEALLLSAVTLNVVICSRRILRTVVVWIFLAGRVVRESFASFQEASEAPPPTE
jgi:hypothetical protein